MLGEMIYTSGGGNPAYSIFESYSGYYMLAVNDSGVVAEIKYDSAQSPSPYEDDYIKLELVSSSTWKTTVKKACTMTKYSGYTKTETQESANTVVASGRTATDAYPIILSF